MSLTVSLLAEHPHMKVRCLWRLIFCDHWVIRRIFDTSICITLYGVSVPSLHRVYRLSDIRMHTRAHIHTSPTYTPRILVMGCFMYSSVMICNRWALTGGLIVDKHLHSQIYHSTVRPSVCSSDSFTTDITFRKNILAACCNVDIPLSTHTTSHPCDRSERSG